jgi:Putative Flp pilus-assembly TadE/G-like
MRGVIGKVLARPSRLRDEERGATAVIVVLTLIALCGMIVLTVDVGQLLFKRRAMVNASDAAALAAAQSCAGIADSDSPEAMADTFALDNVTAPNATAANIIDIEGCDGPPYGHVTVEYSSQQNLFFAGVLGFDGPAAVRTQATAGWGPAGGASPLPIAVYVGDDQGNCDIQEGIGSGVSCNLWYDNDTLDGSTFGFLNLCTGSDPCNQGWDVGAGDNCPSDRSHVDEWISGSWTGGPNEVNYPAPTYVCKVSGLATNIWDDLEQRASANHDSVDGDSSDLIFPVNDCLTQVDQAGNIVACNEQPDKYNIIGFIVLHLHAVLDDPSEWEGVPESHCQKNQNLNPGQVVPLSALVSGQCPSGSTPSGVEDLTIDGQGPGATFSYDDLNKTITWNGPPSPNARFDFDWWLDGKCGQPPSNSSAVCLQVTTVEVRFGGSSPGHGADFGLRAVQLCDLGYASCPRDD